MRKAFVGLIAATLFMFAFSFMLVPLYNVFCEVTGLMGKYMDHQIFLNPKKKLEKEMSTFAF